MSPRYVGSYVIRNLGRDPDQEVRKRLLRVGGLECLRRTGQCSLRFPGPRLDCIHTVKKTGDVVQ